MGRNRALCAAWLEWLERQGRSRVYVYQSGAALERLVAWWGDRGFDELRLADLERWVARPLPSGAMRAAASRQKDAVLVRSLFGWAHGRGLCPHNPAAELASVRVRNANPRAIDVALWQRVWLSPEVRDDERVVLGLGFFCGLRREEVCRLRAEHVDVRRGALVDFKRKGDQGDKGRGVVPVVSCARLFGERMPALIGVPESFLDPLWAAVGAAGRNGGWLLGWGANGRQGGRRAALGMPEGMTSPDQVNRRVQLMLLRLGLPGRAFTPHALRHSFVTYMLEMGVPIQTVGHLANHADINVTQRYVKVALDPLAQYLGQSLTTRPRW